MLKRILGKFCSGRVKWLATFRWVALDGHLWAGFDWRQRAPALLVALPRCIELTANSARGKSVILRIAEAGRVVGLPGKISGPPYEVTAEALEPLQVNFIGREPFLDFLAPNGDACLKVAGMLTSIDHATYREVRYLALSGSAAQKLAAYLVDLPAQNSPNPVEAVWGCHDLSGGDPAKSGEPLSPPPAPPSLPCPENPDKPWRPTPPSIASWER